MTSSIPLLTSICYCNAVHSSNVTVSPLSLRQDKRLVKMRRQALLPGAADRRMPRLATPFVLFLICNTFHVTSGMDATNFPSNQKRTTTPIQGTNEKQFQPGGTKNVTMTSPHQTTLSDIPVITATIVTPSVIVGNGQDGKSIPIISPVSYSPSEASITPSTTTASGRKPSLLTEKVASVEMSSTSTSTTSKAPAVIPSPSTGDLLPSASSSSASSDHDSSFLTPQNMDELLFEQSHQIQSRSDRRHGIKARKGVPEYPPPLPVLLPTSSSEKGRFDESGQGMVRESSTFEGKGQLVESVSDKDIKSSEHLHVIRPVNTTSSSHRIEGLIDSLKSPISGDTTTRASSGFSPAVSIEESRSSRISFSQERRHELHPTEKDDDDRESRKIKSSLRIESGGFSKTGKMTLDSMVSPGEVTAFSEMPTSSLDGSQIKSTHSKCEYSPLSLSSHFPEDSCFLFLPPFLSSTF